MPGEQQAISGRDTVRRVAMAGLAAQVVFVVSWVMYAVTAPDAWVLGVTS